MLSNQNANAQNNNMSKGGSINNNKQRPEIRDNLDHREGEEQETKGDDVTHNEKETQNNLKEKKDK